MQVYGGLVYMDFDKQHMAEHGCGVYESLDPGLLPRLWLIFCENPSDSGRVHSSVKQRWLAGDPAVVQGMQDVARCAEDGRCARTRWHVWQPRPQACTALRVCLAHCDCVRQGAPISLCNGCSGMAMQYGNVVCVGLPDSVRTRQCRCLPAGLHCCSVTQPHSQH